MKLSELKPGMSGIIAAVGGEKALRRHLLDMGLTPKTRVMMRKIAPLGDPLELNIRGYELTIRKDDAEMIELFETENPYACSSCTAGSCPFCSSRKRPGSFSCEKAEKK